MYPNPSWLRFSPSAHETGRGLGMEEGPLHTSRHRRNDENSAPSSLGCRFGKESRRWDSAHIAHLHRNDRNFDSSRWLMVSMSWRLSFLSRPDRLAGGGGSSLSKCRQERASLTQFR